MLQAPGLLQQPVSVTRQLSASLPRLRAVAQQKGLKIHHLGAGYPHPEVTDPRAFLRHKAKFHQHLASLEGVNDEEQLPEFLRECYAYADTLGPVPVREHFAQVYGADLGVSINPERLLPAVGATGGMALVCSLFERSGEPLAFLTDAPTYAGFVARARLAHQTRLFSVELDDEGPILDIFRAQIRAARADGRFIPCYYTIPDGHNPAGFSFSAERRAAVMDICREEDILILEDAPYIYINYQQPEDRPRPYVSLDPAQTIHLFTGSKIGFPGARVGFVYSEARVAISGGKAVPITELLLSESACDLLFPNPEALYGFDAILHDENMQLRDSLWPVANDKLRVYRENRQIMLDVLQEELGGQPDRFSWTLPQAGFFCVFRCHDEKVTTDDAFIEQLITSYGLVVVPMYDFYPLDARERNPRIGMNELRLSFCFSESYGDARRADMREATATFCDAMQKVT